MTTMNDKVVLVVKFVISAFIINAIVNAAYTAGFKRGRQELIARTTVAGNELYD